MSTLTWPAPSDHVTDDDVHAAPLRPPQPLPLLSGESTAESTWQRRGTSFAQQTGKSDGHSQAVVSVGSRRKKEKKFVTCSRILEALWAI